jgi:hypothetical protein
LPRKTHTSLSARSAAAVKRAGDINAGPALSRRPNAGFYAARPLDGGEERARNAANRPNIHTNPAEEPILFWFPFYSGLLFLLLVSVVFGFSVKNESLR